MSLSPPPASHSPTLHSTPIHSHQQEQQITAKRQKLKFPWVSLCAGATGGIISTTLLQPFDVAKTTMINPQYRQYGMVAVWRSVVQQEGVAGMWRGLSPALMRITIGSSVYFSTQTYLLHVIQRNQKLGEKVKSSQWVSVGALSRAIAVATACPISVVKTRFEGTSTARQQYKSVFDAMLSIVRKHGVSGLWAGVIPSVVKDAPYSGVYLLLYTNMKEMLGSRVYTTHSQGSDLAIQFVSGFAAGGLATALFQPLEVIKTRQQLAGQLSLIQCTKSILSESGVVGFYRGVVPRMLRRSFSNALSWMIFEQISGFYKQFTGL